MVRKNRIALIDPVNEVAYSRPVRKGSAGNYVEDTELQDVLDDRGIDEAKLFASRRFHGVAIAVLAD